jgi:glycosyltransferase involved in cell wall biosynthesis
MKRRLAALLQEEHFDVVQIEILYMTPYVETVKKYSNAKIILRSHNVEHLLWERISQETGNILKRWYLKTLARRLKNYELGNLNTYDGIVTISAHDAAFFREAGCTIPLTDVPFGVETEDYKPSKIPSEFPSLFHLGSMNWLPNEEGIRWFLEKAWPLITEKFPELKLYLAGRMMPDWLNKLETKNVEVLGEVPDARMFMLSKGVMVVPLFSGSGIRIKIIEGMALGKTVISTTVGAEGINYTSNKNILIADDEKEFLTAIEQCVTNKYVTDQVGEEARKLILQEHSLEHVLKKLETFYRQVLEKT